MCQSLSYSSRVVKAPGLQNSNLIRRGQFLDLPDGNIGSGHTQEFGDSNLPVEENGKKRKKKSGLVFEIFRFE